ncbi:serine hydrolase domain-containing protein [Actinomadura parmotrematis]|uniref:Beta-lactamase family protein n=1 Tax=Actinomadura parmotrematis TaxID=2864039 RepID=A0ABS7FUU5_9ACTN|nr:serine hydrolase domain-containing protein [Actinomadura parmotrematis]MBW8484192.1 beta-lactamase family protein [Actinomadura parmotrematis]
MSELRDILDIDGAVALVAAGDGVEVATRGADRDTVFRIASVTKPIVSAAALTLVGDGTLGLDEPVTGWLPELDGLRVVRTPDAPLDDTVPAARPMTVRDVLASRCGYGLPGDFGLPAAQALFDGLQRHVHDPQDAPPPDAWLRRLAQLPMAAQPGEAWLYNTAYDVLGVLLARAAGRPLPEVLAERIFEPLGMAGTGFVLPPGRALPLLRHDGAGGLAVADPPDGSWAEPAAFPAGSAGLVSTADDLLAFGRMLLGAGPRVLPPEAVALMTADHTTAADRAAGRIFLQGQGWGFGGSVDVAAVDPWNVPGRYGWVGGTGTAFHVVPATGLVSVLLTQVQLAGPSPTPLMRAFWTRAAGAAPGPRIDM